MHQRNVLILNDNGQPKAIEGIVTDITECKRDEKALLDKTTMLDNILRSVRGVAIATTDLDFHITYWNPMAEKLYGYTFAGVIGKTVMEIHKKENVEAKRFWRAIETVYRDGKYRYTITKETDDGVREFQSTVAGIFDPDGEVVGYSLFSYDVTEQKRAEEDRERLLKAIEQVAETILITDAKGNIQYANPAFEQVTGYSQKEAVGETLRILKSGEQNESFHRKMWQTLTSGDTWKGRLINRKKDGTFYTEEATISPVLDETGEVVNYVAVKRDITNEIRMEVKLRQSQKMEAIGTLAGGIAHDFNNMLFPLMGYSEMLKDDLPADSPLQSHVDEIIRAALRSKDLVKQILAFSRQGDQEIKPIKLQPIVKEALKLLRSSIPTTISIQQDIDPGCGIIVADPTQVHQIVMNLATNAYHAMEATGGRLKVHLKQERLEPGQSLLPELVPGEYALLTIADTGIGIGKDIMDKIFDPYFTTKETGKGTGLGLSVVQGIVKSCDGDIRIYSEPGKGTEVHVYLPIMAPKGVDIQTDPSEPIQSGTEKILLVDDEATIVKMEQQMLERMGYRVTIRTGSVDALEAFKANYDAFDLVITDMTMPNMTGIQLAEAIKKIRPEIPVILCTGFSHQINKEKSKALGIQGYVMKPVIKREIAEVIRKVLDDSVYYD